MFLILASNEKKVKLLKTMLLRGNVAVFEIGKFCSLNFRIKELILEMLQDLILCINRIALPLTDSAH